MPVLFANKLRGAAREPQDDLLAVGVFALPDLETVLEQALNVLAGGPWIGKLVLF